jgi:CDP-4-dehydro-6-deoxyglucose reductase, E1
MENKIFYNQTNYGDEEIDAVVEVLKTQSFSLVSGKKSLEFEKEISGMFGKKFGLFVNSGSSANLLALASLDLNKGSEIITPCLTFSTTISPILQLGLIPSLVDVDIRTLNIKVQDIEKCINKNTKAIFVPNLIGNVPDWDEIKKIAKKYNLHLIEDSADTIGYDFRGSNTGQLSDISTTSFYGSHIITCAGIGGMACTNDPELYEKMKIVRGWGRSSELFSPDASLSIEDNLKDRFDIEINGMSYDKKFIFEKEGYNFFAPEICAAFGLIQLKRFDEFFTKRVANFNYLKNSITNKLSNYIITPEETKGVKTNWLAYPIILRESEKNLRTNLQIFLERKNIQTRTIFSGNITRQPIMDGKVYRTNEFKFENADYIMKNGMLVGCHPKLEQVDLDYICNSLIEFFDGR